MRQQIPILMSTPMVQAEKEGRKTVTRRTRGLDEINKSPDDFSSVQMEFDENGNLKAVFICKNGACCFSVRSPYGKKGDFLWVRETFREFLVNKKIKGKWEVVSDFHYKADGDPNESAFFDRVKWSPSIHMPKAAARIWLEVIDIRVERLQDISEADAMAEGVKPLNSEHTRWQNYLIPHSDWDCAVGSFHSLWCSINGPDSWEANPWVWVVSFKVFQLPANQVNWKRRLLHAKP